MGIQALADTFGKYRGALFAAPLVASLALGGLAASANDAYAQDASVQTVATQGVELASDKQVGEIIGDAAGYGFSGQGIGIVVLIGDDLRGTGKSPEYFANGFEELFSKQGVKAEAYATHVSGQNSGFEFYTTTQKFGMYNLDQAMRAISQVASLSKEEQALKVSSLETN